MSARRTSFHFPREAVAELNAIRAQTYLQNSADVIRLALSVYDVLLDLVETNRKIVVRQKDGREWPYSPYAPFSYPGLSEAGTAGDEQPNGDQPPKNFFFSG